MNISSTFLDMIKNALYGLNTFFSWLISWNFTINGTKINGLFIISSGFVIACISIMLVKKLSPYS